jgi:hypothetical protein
MAVGAVVALLATVGAATAAAPRAWLADFEGGFPADMLFVKGKKVAGTTLGGVVRRIGARHGVAFFSPKMPEKPPASWKSGGRERWILEEFGKFAASADGKVGWGQEQTLSPRRRGLNASSGPLHALAARSLRLTVVREPVAHALSASAPPASPDERSSRGERERARRQRYVGARTSGRAARGRRTPRPRITRRSTRASRGSGT